ncbi:PAS-domain containing protein [Hyphococcus flavus]|uniref:histidine kinase n=1 Tax=Hyphococcus flavus TaxID=1866326 RepID=A0AAF0CGB7_9PROT|nr:PAS domain-containing sensor histidine kinase [Hyphococcus flavus]WDI30477.1 PAS-domain containing protein [Hyphococcus flavus]
MSDGMKHWVKKLLIGTMLSSTSALATAPVLAAGETGAGGAIDPLLAGAGGAIALAVAAVIWALRISAANRNQSLHWSEKLAEMEARLEKADSVLSAHPGLVLVWEDDAKSANGGWGSPKILGGPAALASLLAFSKEDKTEKTAPVDRLLNALGALRLQDEDAEEPETLKEKIKNLRDHGVAFSGNVVTADGRTIEVDGRVAGGQVALWITDPAVRMAEDGAVIGAFRERATDLHGALALLERSPVPAWRRNADLELVWVNRAYADIVEAANVGDVIKQQTELDNTIKKLASTAASERKPQDGKTIINSRGERRVFRIVEMPLHGSGDAALGGVAIDITEQDKAKSDLKQQIEANQRTLDQIHTAVAIFGASQNLIYYNRAFRELWALDEAELSGRVYHGEILDQLRVAGHLPEPSDYEQWKEKQLALYTEGLSEPGSERLGGAPDEVWHLPDGRTLQVSKQRHPFGGVMTAFEDITEKLTLETQFNTQLSVQKATLNNLAEGVAVFAADGSMRLYNKAFQKVWRLDARLTDSRPHIDLIIENLDKLAKDPGDAFDALRRCVVSKSHEDRKPIEIREIKLVDGRTLAVGTEPLPDGATLARFLDVTDSKEREKELKERNAILENADRLKSKFVDHVSYQLRTPLSTIIGFSEMLEGEMFGVLNDRQKDYVASVLSASYHLRDLINDIIDLAAIDAGQLEVALKKTDIRKLLESAATFAALKAEDTQVTLKVDCPKDIGETEMDDRRIKQVLFNLLSNAFAYTGAGGQVTLGARRVGDAVKIWVSDTGRGLSPTDQARAFDAFESRGPSAGAGLGLALVERFIKLHHGWVRMDSSEGHGVTVTCFLPEQTKAAAANTTDKATSSQASAPQPKGKDNAPKPAKKKAPARQRRRAKSKSPGSDKPASRPQAAE